MKNIPILYKILLIRSLLLCIFFFSSPPSGHAQFYRSPNANYTEDQLWYHPAYSGAEGRPVIQTTVRAIDAILFPNWEANFMGISLSADLPLPTHPAAGIGVNYINYVSVFGSLGEQKLSLPLSYRIYKQDSLTWLRLGIQPTCFYEMGIYDFTPDPFHPLPPIVNPGKSTHHAIALGWDLGAWFELKGAWFTGLTFHNVRRPKLRYKYITDHIEQQWCFVTGGRFKLNNKFTLSPTFRYDLVKEGTPYRINWVADADWRLGLSLYGTRGNYYTLISALSGDEIIFASGIACSNHVVLMINLDYFADSFYYIISKNGNLDVEAGVKLRLGKK
ncbi:MAG: type IX secretion system membrane protein PorP/SprF [Flavobacteriales bacterium]|nr:type IX secretion system membrane protein PorP/SprF [Flavobacteriales bacterium]MCB9449499.1 type IX secretion system membrane protein PorP/SprF [Flavobacteriales bacterium]